MKRIKIRFVKRLLFCFVMLVFGVQVMQAETTTISAQSNGTMTWSDEYMDYTLSGGTITWNSTQQAYVLSANTTYNLTWKLKDANNLVQVTGVSCNVLPYADQGQTGLFGNNGRMTWKAGSTTNNITVRRDYTFQTNNITGLSLGDNGSASLTTSAASTSLFTKTYKFTYYLKSITVNYTIAKPFQFSANAYSADESKGTAKVSFVEGTYTDASATTAVKAQTVTAANGTATAYFKADAVAPYAFTGWSETENGEIISTANPYNATITSASKDAGSPANMTLYANFAKAAVYNFSVSALSNVSEDVTVSATLSNGATTNTVGGLGSAKETATFTASSSSLEYEFVGWSETENGATLVSTDATYTVELTNTVDESTVSKTLYAIFRKQSVFNLSVTAMRNISAGGKVSATFDANGKSSIQVVGVVTNEPATFAAYTNAGYHFVGWAETADGAIISTNATYQTTVVSANPDETFVKTLYAIFEEDAAPALDNSNYYTKLTIKQHPTSPKGAGVVAIIAGDDNSDSETKPSLNSGTYSNETTLLRKATMQSARDNETNQTVTSYSNRYWLCAKANDGYEFVGWAANLTESFRRVSNPWETFISVEDNAVLGNDHPTEAVYYAQFRKKVTSSADDKNETQQTGVVTVTPGTGSVVSYIENVDIVVDGTGFTQFSDGQDVSREHTSQKLEVFMKQNENWIKVTDMTVKDNGSKDVHVKRFLATADTRLMASGTYKIVIPANYFAVYNKKVTPNAWYYFNTEDIAVELTIPGNGEETVSLIAQSESAPAKNGHVVNELSEVTLTYPVAITEADRNALAIYTSDGDFVCSSTNYTLSNANQTITYSIPTLTYGNYYVALEAGAVRGDGWENMEVNESEYNIHFSVVKDLRPELVWTPGTWKIEDLTFQVEEGSDIEVCYQRIHNQIKNDIYIYNKATGARTSASLAAAGVSTDPETGEYNYLKYNGNKVTMTFFLKNVLIGEGTYYVDIPAYTFCSEGVYNETPIHYEFTLAATQPTNFTVSPAAGSQLSKITQIVLTVNDAKSSIAVTSSDLEYLMVSKDGGTPIKYNIFEYERDGDTSGGNEYGSATQLTVEGNKATIQIAEGFATALGGYDNFGFASSGTYTITVPAGLFYIDGLNDYTTTDMTFTYVVKNNVVETRKFAGRTSLVSPSIDEIYTNMAEDLKDITLHIEDADNFAVLDDEIHADINGVMELESYEVDAEALTLTLHMKPVEGKELTTSGDAVLTVTGYFEANGREYFIANEEDIDYSYDFYGNFDPFTYTFQLQTEEEKNRSNIIITPETGATMKVLKMDIREPEKYALMGQSHEVDVKVPILRGEEETGYYITWASKVAVQSAGLTAEATNEGLKVVDAEGNDAEITRGGTYNFTLPVNFYHLSDKASYAEVPSKLTYFEYVVPNPENDYNEDGLVTLADVAALIRKQIQESIPSTERIETMVDFLLEK